MQPSYLGDFNATKVITWYLLRSDGDVNLIDSKIVPKLEDAKAQRISNADRESLILTSTGVFSLRDVRSIWYTCSLLHSQMNLTLGKIGAIQEGFYLVFRTSSVYFDMVSHTSGSGSKASAGTQLATLVECNLIDKDGKTVSLTSIPVDNTWYSMNKTKPVECVCVGADLNAQTGDVQRVKVMLLETDGVFSVRIGLGWISRDDWCSAAPRRQRMVFLG